MTEKRFLSFICTESILLLILGMSMLILPKVTDITFGFVLCLVTLIYGGYKVIASFLSRSFELHYILNIIGGVLLIIFGIFLLMAPAIDVILVVSLLGLYFIISSICSAAFAYQVKKVLNCWYYSCVLSFIQIFFGIVLTALIPALWTSGIFLGINYILTGVMLLSMYFSKQYSN